MSSQGAELLYSLLPLIHRARDEARGGSLRALLEIIGGEYDRLKQDIGLLYDNAFIETCEDWVVPYIGELVGVRTPEHAGAQTPVQRAQVANAILNRRRKGVPVTLERAIREAYGWSAHVVELFRYLARTQHVEHVNVARGREVDVRIEARLRRELGFGPEGHTVDVRAIGRAEGQAGLFNAGNAGVFVCRTESFPVERSEPRQVADGCYTFHPLGWDVPLFAVPRPVDPMRDAFEGAELPLPIETRVLAEELERVRRALREDDAPPVASRWVGPERAVEIFLGGASVPPADVFAGDLEGWHRPGPGVVGLLSAPIPEVALPPRVELEVQIGEGPFHAIAFETGEGLRALGDAMEAALRRASPRRDLAAARVIVMDDRRLLVLPGVPVPGSPVRFRAREDAGGLDLLGLSPEAARRAAVLHSPPVEVLEEQDRSEGDLLLRLGRGEPLEVHVPLGSPAGDVRAALHRQLRERGWLVLVDHGSVMVVAEADDPGDYLCAEDAPGGQAARRLGLGGRVAVDPHRGRLALSLGYEAEGLRVTWAFGRAAEIGAGPYPHEQDPDVGPLPEEARPAGAPARAVWRADVCKAFGTAPTQVEGAPLRFAELADALAAWKPEEADGVIRILDSSTYHPVGAGAGQSDFTVQLLHGSLTIEAAYGEVPSLAGGLSADGALFAALRLEGLQIEGTVITGAARTELAWCTLPAGLERVPPRGFQVEVAIHRSLVGPLRLPDQYTTLRLSECIVSGEGGAAIAGFESSPTRGPGTILERCTMLGEVKADWLQAGESLFTDAVEVVGSSQSLLRSCALPYDSGSVPRQRGLLFAAPAEAVGPGVIPSSPSIRSRVMHDPYFGRLSEDGPEELRTGAEDGGELGAYHHLQERRRLTGLHALLDEFLPAGLSAGVLFLD